MRKWIGLLLLVIASALFGFGLLALAFGLYFAAIGFAPEKHTYTLDEIGQTIHSPIPDDAIDIQFTSETKYGILSNSVLKPLQLLL